MKSNQSQLSSSSSSSSSSSDNAILLICNSIIKSTSSTKLFDQSNQQHKSNTRTRRRGRRRRVAASENSQISHLASTDCCYRILNLDNSPSASSHKMTGVKKNVKKYDDLITRRMNSTRFSLILAQLLTLLFCCCQLPVPTNGSHHHQQHQFSTSSSKEAIQSILLDTTEQSSLGWTRYPDGGPGGQGRTPGWSEETFLQVERDINWRSFVTCDVAYNSVNNWLWTPYLERGDASRLYVEMKFTMRDCNLFPQMVLSCKETFALLYKEVDGPMVHSTSGSGSSLSAANVSFAQSDTFQLVQAIAAAEGRFTSNNDVVINTEISSVPVSKRGVYFAFRDQGACLSLISIKVYALKCPQLVTNLARFNSTPTGREHTSLVPVEGECVANSVQIEPPRMFCAADGQWNSIASGQCKCLAGFEPANNHTKCQACPVGRFKASLGDSPCLPCPEHSSTGQLASTECKCHDGYFRASKDSRSAPCTQPPGSGPVNLSATYVDSTSVVLQWAPPTRTGNRDDLTYKLLCDSCDFTTLVSSPQFLTNFSETKCVLAGLQPNTQYRFSLFVANGVTLAAAAAAAAGAQQQQQQHQQFQFSEISVQTASSSSASQAIGNKRANEPLSSQNGGFQFLPITNFRALPGARGHDILLAWDSTSASPTGSGLDQQLEVPGGGELPSLYEVKFQPRFAAALADSPARRSPYPLLFSAPAEHTPPQASTPPQSITTTNRAIGIYSLAPRTEYAFQIRAKFPAPNQWTDWSEPIYATSGHGPAHASLLTSTPTQQFASGPMNEDLLIQFDPLRNIFAQQQQQQQQAQFPQQQQQQQQATSGWLGSLVIILLCSLVVSLLLVATLVHYRHSVCLKSLSPLLSGNLMGGTAGGSSNVGSTYAGVYNGGTSSDLISGVGGGGLYGPTVTQIYHNGAGGLTLHAHHMGQHHAQHHLHSGSAGALITGSNSTSRSSSTGTGNVVQNFLAATLGQLAGTGNQQSYHHHNHHNLSKTLSQQQHEQGKLFLHQSSNNQQQQQQQQQQQMTNNNIGEQNQRQHSVEQARNHYHQMLGNANHTLLLSGSHGQYQPTGTTTVVPLHQQQQQCNGADLFNHQANGQQQQSKYDNSRTLSGQQQQQLYGLAADPQLHIYDDLEVVAAGEQSPSNSKFAATTRANETLLQERLKAQQQQQQQQQLYAREVYENPASKSAALVIGANGPSTTIVQPLAATRTAVAQQQQRLFASSRRDDRTHSEEFYDD